MNRVVNTICASLLSVFLASCGASRTPIKVSYTDILTDDCAIMRNFLSSQGDEVIKVDKELIGFSELCKNHQLMSMLINSELENPDPEVRAIVTAAAVKILTGGSLEFKNSLLAELGREYDITEADMIARKERDDAIKAVKATPEVDCTQISDNAFFCQ